jgi:hypothetical protein
MRDELLAEIARLDVAIAAVEARRREIIDCPSVDVIRALCDARGRLDQFAHDADTRWTDRHIPARRSKT